MDSIKFLIDSFPESPFVLSHCANTLYRTQYKQAAEQLVIGVLMLNPNYDHALRLYAHILIEQGQYRLAARYLHRIDSKSPLWSVTQLEIAWLIEINGAEADGAILAYKSCATNSNKNNYIISRAMHSIGITYHLLNDESNAFEYYRRSLLYDSDNCQSSVLFAAFGVANNLNNKFTQKSVGSNAQTYCLSNDEIDSQYRRGLIAMERCSYQWIPTLGYADFQAFVLQDYERAERYYNNANQLGSSLTVWPAIAYAHYYQYILGDLRRANNVMIRIMNARGLPLVDSPDFNVAPVYESKTVHSRIAQLVVDEELAALYVACAYIYLDWKEFEYAAKCTAKALQFSENYSPALRCISIITVTTSGDLQLAMRYLKLGITQCPNNPFILRIGSLINLKLYNYDLAISMMDSAVLNGLQFPLAHRCAGIMSYLFKCSTEKYDKVLYCLHKAYELSNGEDVDAARLKGQVLMEMGKLPIKFSRDYI